VPLQRVAVDWTRIGLTGFGGPPTHIALLRNLVVERRGWISDDEFQDAIAACNLLPGPASTQLAIFCARRAAGRAGALVGGIGFIVPAVIMITALSTLFLAQAPPRWVRGAGAGAGAVVAAVAVRAGLELLLPSWRRAERSTLHAARWIGYVILGALSAWLVGAYVVLMILVCGVLELILVTRSATPPGQNAFTPLIGASTAGGVGSLAWVALKVGALSFGGGFVIVPLMRTDAVHTYHWMTATQFLYAVALGQITPGPVVATIAAVGYAAHGIGGALLGAVIAFLPSFVFVLVGGGHFERLRRSARAQRFLDGAGPAAIGAILGASIPLAAALDEAWQFAVLAAAAVALLVLRRGLVQTLLAAGLIGAIIGVAGGPLP
jgi:chromate transporter